MIQHKDRRVDLVEDEEWLYAFYDHKLPPDVRRICSFIVRATVENGDSCVGATVGEGLGK